MLNPHFLPAAAFLVFGAMLFVLIQSHSKDDLRKQEHEDKEYAATWRAREIHVIWNKEIGEVTGSEKLGDTDQFLVRVHLSGLPGYVEQQFLSDSPDRYPKGAKVQLGSTSYMRWTRNASCDTVTAVRIVK